MIVKNESKVLLRCLASVLPWIDSWVIVDTGSNDGTPEILSKFLQKIPGKLYERPWANFSYNRNEALQFAKNQGDYLLFIDADDQLLGSFDKTSLDLDYYAINYRKSTCTTKRILLVKESLPWKWEGEIHETLLCPSAQKKGFFPNAWIQAGKGGYRDRDPETLQKDIALLKELLRQGKDPARALFHLGVFSEEAQDYPFALECFEKRVALGGWDQEIFYALFRIAALQDRLAFPFEIVRLNYEKAHLYRPSRSEPIVALGLSYLARKEDEEAYHWLEKAVKLPLPSDTIYVMQSLYDYEALFFFADAAFRLGKAVETWDAYRKLLNNPRLPTQYRDILENNYLQVLARVYRARYSLWA